MSDLAQCLNWLLVTFLCGQKAIINTELTQADKDWPSIVLAISCFPE